MASSSPDLSIVAPVRDEEDSLPALVREVDGLRERLAAVGIASEFLVVDDGSRDASLRVALDLSGKHPFVRVIALDAPEGQSAALAAGFRAARGGVIATLDADLQNDPADLPRLLCALAAGADVANGVRAERSDGPWRRFTSSVANAVRNAATGHRVSDVGCSLRAMRAPFVRRIKLYRGMHRFLPTLLFYEGARIVEVPVAHRPRRHGRSKYGTWGRLVEGVVDLCAVMWMRRRALRQRSREVGGAEVELDSEPPRPEGSRGA